MRPNQEKAASTSLVSDARDHRTMFTNVERAVRSLRRRRQWTQTALGGRAGVSREMVSRIERGDVAGMTISSLEHVAAALGATLLVQLRWQGANLDRLMDAAHARLQEDVASWLTTIGWVVHVEVSFNHYGDRGRVDIVAFHPTLRLVLIIEIKSALGDIQDTLGRLDVKARLGRVIAAELGWNQVSAVVPALVITDSRAVRRQIAAHEALFERYSLRGRKATAWLRRPAGTAPTGILWFRSRSDSHGATTRR